MAKRKKLKNVKIVDQELTPTTLGYLDEKKSSPIFLIFLFGLFLGFLYFIPEINKYIEEKRGNTVYNPNDPIVDSFDQNDAGKEFLLSDKPLIVLNEITISNFTLENNKLIITVANNSGDSVDLSSKEYYLYLKDTSNMVETISLKDIIVMAKDEKQLSFDVSTLDYTSVMIDVFKEEYLGDVVLENNALTCVKNLESYTYYFVDNQLKSIMYSMDNTNPTDSEVSIYEQKKNKYENMDGVGLIFNNDNSLYFELNIDLEKVAIDQLDDDKFYQLNASPKIINFEMKQNEFNCK